MARIETWFDQDLKEAVKVRYIDGNVFSQDNKGNVIGVNVYDDGEPASLTGSVSGSVVRSDGATVAVVGSLDGNKCSIVLPQSAYAVPGVISVVIKLTNGEDITTVCAVVGNVYVSTTDSVVDPGTIIPSVETLIAEIEAAVATIPPDYSELVANTFNFLSSYSTKINAYTNLDDLQTPGNYKVANASDAGNITNYPFSIGGRVLVFQTSNASVVVQLCIPNNAEPPKFRLYNGTAWSDFKQLVTDDDFNALKSNVFNLSSDTAISIESGADLDDYTTPGNYKVANAVVASSITNYPFSVGGRILIFQTTNNVVVAQVCIPNNSEPPKYRLHDGTAWSDFMQFVTNDEYLRSVRGIGLVTQIGLTDLDNAPFNTIIGYVSSDIQNLAHFPEQIVKGGLIVTLNYSTNQNGRIQFVIPWESSLSYAKRFYQSGWSGWTVGEGVTTITVGSGKDFENLVDALDYVTSDELRNTWNEYNQVVIELDAGTFSMEKIVTLYSQDSTRYKWGVYIPRYCTVRGKGKDQTILTYNYTGSDDWVLGHLSPINMPYESTMQDLSIVAKNCRYCVHSDGDNPFDRVWALSNNKITVKNVRMEHQGYSAGNNPTYNVPSAWGQGFRDNCVREFINCDFIANHMPWFTHDSVGQTLPSENIFRNCTFINKRSASFSSSGEYAGPTFISWGTNIRNPVTFENCYSNRYTCIRGTTTYDPNTTCDYFVSDDGGNMVVEGLVNSAHLLNNWINRNCAVASANANLTGYKPCSIDIDGFASAYSSTGYMHGIALYSCQSGESITVQTSGLVPLDRLGVSGFSVGSLVGWNGSAWVSDSTTPVIKVISQYVGIIV